MRAFANMVALVAIGLGLPSLAQATCVQERERGSWTAQMGDFFSTDDMERFSVGAYGTVFLSHLSHRDGRTTYQGRLLLWRALFADNGQRTLAGHSTDRHERVPALVILQSYGRELTRFEVTIEREDGTLIPSRPYRSRAEIPAEVAELMLSYLATGSDVEMLFALPDPAGQEFRVRNSVLLASDDYYAVQEGLFEDYDQRGPGC